MNLAVVEFVNYTMNDAGTAEAKRNEMKKKPETKWGTEWERKKLSQ